MLKLIEKYINLKYLQRAITTTIAVNTVTPTIVNTQMRNRGGKRLKNFLLLNKGRRCDVVVSSDDVGDPRRTSFGVVGETRALPRRAMVSMVTNISK